MSRLGELLLRRSVLTQDQLIKAVTEQQQQGGVLAAHLVRLNLVNEDDLAGLLQREYRLPIIDPQSFEIAPEALAIVPHVLATKHHVLPVSLIGSTLTLAMADPSNL